MVYRIPIGIIFMTFESFSGITILAWFLRNPTKKIHFKSVCRETKLGPSTVKSYLDEFVKKGWISEERQANLRLFILNNSNYVVQSMKKTYYLELFHQSHIDKIVDESAISLALYGSFASGDYDEISDVDLLIIGSEDSIVGESLKKFKNRIMKKVQINTISLVKWEKNKEEDPFIRSILKNHVLIKGVQL